MQRNVDYSTIDLMGRTSELGNHHQKYILSIEQHYDTLISLLDEHHLIDQIRLLRFSSAPEKHMRTISSLLDDRETKLDMVGCYYSLQFLLLNFKAIDVLKLDLSTKTINSYNILRDFLVRTGNDFRLLSRAYMRVLLDEFLPEQPPRFNIFSVGTRVDQEDIDIGILDTGKENRPVLTKAVSKLYSEMIKHASALHFHISEHIGEKGYSASIPEFHHHLDDTIGNFVLLNEMLNSVSIIGDENLYKDFQNDILLRYYYNEQRNNKYHEGFLRGVLGEIQDLVTREFEEETLNPKKDGLRLIKGTIAALKSWKGLTEHTTTLGVLKYLYDNDIDNRDEYYRLYRSLTFLETFRFLYQLFVVQEEEISLEDRPVFEHLDKVAETMGFAATSYAKPSTQLLIHYKDHIKVAKLGTKKILENISNHLSEITIFQTGKFNGTKRNLKEYRSNIAEGFLSAMDFFYNTRYWDDLLALLDRDAELLQKFLNDFNQAAPSIASRYVKWGKRSPYVFIFFFTIVKKNFPRYLSRGNILHLQYEFIKNIKSTLEDIGNLGQVLEFYPKKMYNFLFILPEDLLKKLIDVLELPILDPEVNKIRKKLLELCSLTYSSSYYFKRFIYRVFNTYQSYLIDFNNPRKFREISEGLLKNIENFNSSEEQIKRLGTYYDFEFMRLGINAINGTAFDTINKEFTIFSDNYIQILFELCRKEVKRTYQNPPPTKDKLGIYVTGGHARKQAFEDDYDLIILLNSTNERQKTFANKIIVEMNKHIIKRSIMPHYKFADRFSSYVTTFHDLKKFFQNPTEDSFIDKSQLLGARLVYGSDHFQKDFLEEIITPYIFEQKEKFIDSLINEIINRNKFHEKSEYLNIKESTGGLRDVENFIFILKAHYELIDPVSNQLFLILINRLPEKTDILKQILSDYYFLKQVRDLYHLMVSDEDQLQMKYLDDLIPPLKKSGHKGFENKSELEDCILSALHRTAKNIRAILKYKNYNLDYDPQVPDKITSQY
ncbi:MAG: hypothetical protein K9M80_00635 [Candidatus Marinimicrobia bacterium]|nr:hypothetical protein [Candidatus Neomarinimicrobiota bacterium]